ncbi:hypothetical protein RIR_jg32610.t1 [Rhizophagus irregularis DAOM 181602=DAOM 197198]|nr:hypothetical protein RIR_jg32610.t1 [Rhizophagus irregularis DAOM 181602=DAOM 197198]
MLYIISIKLFSVIDALNDDAINAENPKDRIWATQLINNLDTEFIISTMLLADLIIFDPKFLPQRESDIAYCGDSKILAEYFVNDRFSTTTGENFSAYFNETELNQKWESLSK